MATIKEIANISKVSQAAVSRILNGDSTLSVTLDTKNRVLEVAKDLGYIKKHKKNEDKSIGVVMFNSHAEESIDNYYQGIRKSVETSLLDEGFKPQLIYRLENKEIKMPKGNLDGLIAIGKFSDLEIEILKRCTKNIVMVDSIPKIRELDCVSIDFREMTYEVLNQLYENGYHDIGFICGREKIGDLNEEYIDTRERIFKEFMFKKGKREEDLVYKIGNFSMKSGFEMMDKLINEYKGSLPRVFFIASDNLSIGALKALQEAKINVPEDIKIISVDNLEVASYSKPSLTSVNVPRDNLGESAVSLLIERLHGRTFPKRVYLNYEIIYRESF